MSLKLLLSHVFCAPIAVAKQLLALLLLLLFFFFLFFFFLLLLFFFFFFSSSSPPSSYCPPSSCSCCCCRCCCCWWVGKLTPWHGGLWPRLQSTRCQICLRARLGNKKLGFFSIGWADGQIRGLELTRSFRELSRIFRGFSLIFSKKGRCWSLFWGQGQRIRNGLTWEKDCLKWFSWIHCISQE